MSFQELSSRERGSKGSVLAVDKIKVEKFSILQSGDMHFSIEN